MRLEGLAEAAEDFFVFVLVFLGEDYERGGGEAVLEAVQAAALFAGFGLGSAFAGRCGDWPGVVVLMPYGFRSKRNGASAGWALAPGSIFACGSGAGERFWG